MDWDSDRIEAHVLPLVTRPGRYVARELHTYRKAHAPERVSVLLAFPDAYEIGMSHLGLKILYHLVNGRDDALAEFVFSPWPDMEAQMRSRGIPLFSLQTGTPAGEFDVLGISLQHELQYTNALNLLDLAGIPIRTEARGEPHPLVIAGGPCCFNPEPMAEFIDAFAIGDGEDLILEIVEAVGRCKRAGCGRRETLERVAEIPGIFAPSFRGVAASDPVRARFVSSLERRNYPPHPPVPLVDIAHNRLGVEIMRGCTRGCRFCQAGMIGRPLREISGDDAVWLAVEGVESGGWDEVSLISLSTSDYSGIEPLVDRMVGALERRRVGVCLPSLRPGGLTEGIARGISRFRHPGLTFAPEAGTSRLRSVINKEFEEESLLEAVRVASRHGWRQVKLYFMVGLPTEEEEDLAGMAALAGTIARVKTNGRSLSVKMSVSPFVPKPHTPFQWERQVTVDQVKEKMRFLKREIGRSRVHLRWPRIEMTVVEGILARGDRRLARVVETVWRSGVRFESWTDSFRFESWVRALSEAGLSPEEFTRARTLDERLPWRVVSAGVTHEYLRQERERAYRSEPTPDCRDSGCRACMEEALVPECRRITLASGGDGRPAAAKPRAPSRARGAPPLGIRRSVRLRYAKMEDVRFTSHLDVVRMFDRAIRRSGLPVVYSAGFSPRPRFSFGPPLPVGMTSRAEYVDFETTRPWGKDDGTRLVGALPSGFEVLEVRGFVGRAAALTGREARDRYRVTFDSYIEELEPSPDPEAWWGLLRERAERWARSLEGAHNSGWEGQRREDAPQAGAARLLSLVVDRDGERMWSLSLCVQTGTGLRRVLKDSLRKLAGDEGPLPLARIEREGYDLWDGTRWVSPMGALGGVPGASGQD